MAPYGIRNIAEHGDDEVLVQGEGGNGEMPSEGFEIGIELHRVPCLGDAAVFLQMRGRFRSVNRRGQATDDAFADQTRLPFEGRIGIDEAIVDHLACAVADELIDDQAFLHVVVERVETAFPFGQGIPPPDLAGDIGRRTPEPEKNALVRENG